LQSLVKPGSDRGHRISHGIESQNKTIEIIEIESRFGFNDMIEKNSSFMGSYLHYMGVLTLGETVPSGKQQFKNSKSSDQESEYR